jgi:hypothetical protein
MGHFSLADAGATFGDTTAMRIVLDCLNEVGIPFDVACLPENGYDGVDLHRIDPGEYTIAIFVCGPWDDHYAGWTFDRFEHCVRIGVNLSVVRQRDQDFDVLFARDAEDIHEPDLVFAAEAVPELPLAGLFLVHPQREYRELGAYEAVEAAVNAYFDRGEAVAIPLDTRHVGNQTSTRSLGQLDALLRRVDFVVTTRLHGLVFSLRAGTPAIAIDPIIGGGKVTAQARAIGWPYVVGVENVSADRIADLAHAAMTADAVAHIPATRAIALNETSRIRTAFVNSLRSIEGAKRDRFGEGGSSLQGA